MKTIPGGWYCGIGGALVAALLAACAAQQYGSVQSADGVTVGESDLGGVVTSANGPEAGVWVIAETTDLPTRYAKMVVTDERGRYVLPGPAASELQRLGTRLRAGGFAQGADRAREAAQPGRRAGAQRGRGRAVLPGDLLVLDARDPGRRASSAATPASRRSAPRSDWLKQMKNIGCIGCHQLGQALHAHDPGSLREIRVVRKSSGSAACSPASPASR